MPLGPRRYLDLADYEGGGRQDLKPLISTADIATLTTPNHLKWLLQPDAAIALPHPHPSAFRQLGKI